MQQRIAVLGGGIIGLCSAYFLRKQGFEVIVIERNGPNRDGCSFGNAGMIVPSHYVPLAAPGVVWQGLRWMFQPDSPFYVHPRFDWEFLKWSWKFWRSGTREAVERASPVLAELNLRSREIYVELSRIGIEMGLQQRGLLMLCKTQAALDHEAQVAASAAQFEVPVEILSRQETQQKDPRLEMDVAGSVYFPSDCHLNPNQFAANLEQHLRDAGVEFHFHSHLHTANWDAAQSHVRSVRLGDGTEIRADQFVLALGSWSAEFGNSLGLKIPLQAGKGYSLTLTCPPQPMTVCSILCEARIAVTPMGSAIRFGGTMELAGLNSQISPRRVHSIINRVGEYYPEYRPEVFHGIEPWSGLRPIAPDGMPYLGRSSKVSNLIVATGHGMMGLSLAPITGQLVSELALHCDEHATLNGNGLVHAWQPLLSPERFA